MKRSEARAALAQTSPAGLGLATDPRFQLPPHLELIDEQLVEAIARSEGGGERERPEILLVAVPPRHGKSTLISHYAPAWYLGTFPDRRVMLASYEADFAAGWGAKARALLAEHGRSLYGARLSERSRAGRRWELTEGGGMVSVGVGGALTGRGAHLLIIDDPLKNAEQALSETVRAKQWDWWLSTTRSRLEPGAVVVVLMTRWHEADLGGRLLQESESGGDPVTEIRLPALAGPEDPLGRAEGEALWPERYSTAYLEKTRDTVGPYWFSAMYQGSPTPDEGGMFKREDFRYFELADDGEGALLDEGDGSRKRVGLEWIRKTIYVDLAVSEKETADYTVATEVWFTPDREMLVRAVHRERIPGPDQPGFIEGLHQGQEIKIEAIGYQSALIQALMRKGLPVTPLRPDKDKVTRASAAGALYRNRRVFHLRGAPWLHALEHELLAFPVGTHDDQVDTIAYAARDLPNLTVRRPRSERHRRRGRPLTAGLMNKQF